MIFKVYFLQQENKKIAKDSSVPVRKTRPAITWLSNKQQSFYGVIYYGQEDNLMF